MALQVGELFASLTVDTDGAEQAMDRIRALGEETAAALGRTLDAQTGQAIGQSLADGVAAGLAPGAGSAIGGAFGQGIAQGILGMRGSILAAAAQVGADAAAVLAQALPAGAAQRGRAAAYAAEGGSAAEETRASLQKSAGSEGAFARMVAQALEGVSVKLDGRTVGSLVAPAVGQALSENIVIRRYGTE